MVLDAVDYVALFAIVTLANVVAVAAGQAVINRYFMPEVDGGLEELIGDMTDADAHPDAYAGTDAGAPESPVYEPETRRDAAPDAYAGTDPGDGEGGPEGGGAGHIAVPEWMRTDDREARRGAPTEEDLESSDEEIEAAVERQKARDEEIRERFEKRLGHRNENEADQDDQDRDDENEGRHE